MKPLESDAIRIPFAAVICTAMLVCQFGCTVRHTVSGADIENDPTETIQPDDKISEVVLKTGEVIVFDKDGGHWRDSSRTQVIQGKSDQGKRVDIAIEDVEQIKMKRISAGYTAYAVLIWTAFVGAFVALWWYLMPYS